MLDRTRSRRRRWVPILTLLILILPGTVEFVFSQEEHSDELTFEELIEIAQDATVDEDIRLDAIDEIGSLRVGSEKARQVIPVLNRLLEDDSAAVRIKAANALFKLDQPVKSLLPAAVSGLKDSDPDTRVRAAYLLWAFDHQAAPAIAEVVEAIADDQPRVRLVAASVLGDIGPDFKETSIPPLTKSLEDSDLKVRVAAAEALAKVDGPIERVVEVFVEAIRSDDSNDPDYSPFSTEYETIEMIGQLGGDAVPAVAALNEALKRGDTYRQTVCAKALGEIGQEASPAIDGLAIALRNGEAKGMPFVHRSWCASDEAATALAIIGVEAVPVLVAALTDPNDRVRANAAESLGNIPASAKTSVPKLAELLDDDNPSVRSHAAWALGKLGRTKTGRDAIEKDFNNTTIQLVKMLFDNTDWLSAPASGGMAQNYSVPWHAVEAIARINPDRQELIAALKASLQEEKSINFAVATTIASIGTDAKALTEPLQKLLDDKTFRAPAAYAIASIEPEFDGLQKVLESSLVKKEDWPDLMEDREIDPVAARGLGLLGKRAESSIPKLKDAVGVAGESEFMGYSSDIIVCCLAILQIDDNDKNASQSLLDALEHSHAYIDSHAIDTAAQAITRLISEENHLRAMVIAQLRNANSEVRLLSATYLTEARIAQTETIATLIELAKKGRYQTRGTAIDLLAKHGPAAKDAVELLIEFFFDRETYTLGGDFHGNGGTSHTVGEKAIAALAAIGRDAVPALKKQLNDPRHHVRAAAAKSLGLIGADASSAIDQLISLTADKSHHVRRESANALGKIASRQTSVDQNLLIALRRCEMDQRHSVRQASRAALQLLE